MKLTAATAAAGTLGPEKLFASEEALRHIHATHFGPFAGVTEGGVFRSVEPFKDVFPPTEMLESLVEYAYSPGRVRYPCVRKSYLDGTGNNYLRGSEEFIRVDWKTALDLVAEKLKGVKKEYGSESIFRTSFAGWAHPGVIGRPDMLQGRFLGLFGGFTDTIGDYSAGAATHLMPYILGSIELYHTQTSHEVILKDTDIIVLWGADPAKTFRIDYAVPNDCYDRWLKRLKEAGKRFICIDPVYTETAKEVGAEWISVRPNTDTALMLGICNELYRKGLYDRGFIERYTVGFDHFEEYLMGKNGEAEKTPEWAAEICGISAGKIRELARLFSNNKTLLRSHYGPQRSQYGEQFHWMLVNLACMLGQIGEPGGGFQFGKRGIPSTGHPIPRSVSQGRNPVQKAIPASRVGEMLNNPGRTIKFNGSRITYPDVRMIYSMGANVLTHHQNINELLEGLRRVDTIVAHEIMWTSSAKYSDIVLPATTTFERNDITFDKNVKYIYAMKKLMKRQHEAMDDYWILTELSDRLGFRDKFTKGRTQMDWIRWSFTSTVKDTSFEEFWNKGYVEFEIPEERKNFIRFEDFREDPQRSPLYTASGKIEIFSEKIASFGYDDCAGHAKWYAPDEWLGSEKAKEYPFHLMSIHPKYRLHSQMDNLSIRNRYKIDNREPMSINPLDAKELGVDNGDLVEIYNERGSIVCGVMITDSVRERVIRVDEGAWFAPEKPGVIKSRCLSGDVNVLTTSVPSSNLSQACAANSTLVNIRKLREKPNAHDAYDPPVVRTPGNKGEER